jgi:hypothetical protein
MAAMNAAGTQKCLAALALSLSLGACAGGAASKPAVEFPGPQTLAAIESRPAPPTRVTEGAVPEGGWTVEVSASPSTGEPWKPASGWDRAVAESIAALGKTPRLTQAMSCVAREMGRYVLQTGKAPPVALRSFITSACGAMAPAVGLLNLGGDVPVAISDDALLAQWKGQITKDLVAHLPANANEVGFAFQRREGKVMALLVFAQVRAEFQALVPVPGEGSQVTIVGRLTDESQYIAAYANQGRFGVNPCFVDPTVARPRFSITCTLAPDDATTRIDLIYAQPKRVLAIPFAHVLVRRPDATQLVYQDTTPATNRTITSAAEFAPAALAALNDVRSQAGLRPVRLANAQSAAAARVAGHFFSAVSGDGNGEQVDTIALALLAGWQVAGGLIRDANFSATLVPGTRDVGRWLATTLEMPLARSALLADEIEEVAFGPVSLADPEALGAMVVGYRFHHGNDHTADVRRLLTRALLARRQRRLGEPKRLGLDAAMKQELARVNAGKATPAEALQSLLDHGVGRFGQNMQGYLLETTSLDALEIPAEVLTQPTLHLEIGVTHHRPPGAAWAQLVILVVFVDYGEQQST